MTSRAHAAGTAQGPGRQDAAPGSVKALVFDVFGTVVDWRTSVAREVNAVAKARGVTIDGAAFADAWRAQYRPSMTRVRMGELPWTTLDDLHRMVLDRILPEFGLAGLAEAERAALNRAWHRLQSWPEVVAGPRMQVVGYYARWGMTPAEALQTAYLPAAQMLNYDWVNHVGSLEKGKYADIIAVAGNPLQDITAPAPSSVTR